MKFTFATRSKAETQQSQKKDFEVELGIRKRSKKRTKQAWEALFMRRQLLIKMARKMWSLLMRAGAFHRSRNPTMAGENGLANLSERIQARHLDGFGKVSRRRQGTIGCRRVERHGSNAETFPADSQGERGLLDLCDMIGTQESYEHERKTPTFG